MQKWDYLVVRSFGGVVMVVNGQDVGSMSGGQPMGQMLSDFLAERGQEGWEVTGMAGVREGTEIVLKRPIDWPEEQLEM
ncbi:MAG: hypothetical protein ACK2U3_17140 [Anaerolineales bacterium]|jgi:hypothetical protein